jgi:hypothetical protein
MVKQVISSSNEIPDFQSAQQPMDFQSIVVELTSAAEFTLTLLFYALCSGAVHTICQ